MMHTLSKQSLADICVPKQELGNEGYTPPEKRRGVINHAPT
jgi:hypothetical protein